MIYAITFNPALDVNGVVEKLVPNEKSYVNHQLETPGGNGINAGLIANRLGADVMLSGFLGGANGKRVSSLLKKEKVKQKFIMIEGSTRFNVTVSESKTHKQTRLSFPGPRIKKTEWSELLDKTLKSLQSQDLVLLGGSLPPAFKSSMVSSLVRKLHQKNIFCMADMPASELKKIINARPSFIKPNLKEFQELTGSKVTKIKDVLAEMVKLQKKVPLICVSSVEGGALIYNGVEAWFGKTPKLKIRSTVGAGDSMVGAMAFMLSQDVHTTPEDLLRLGLAASSATLSAPGLNLGHRRSITDFVPKIKLKRVL